MKRKVFIHTNLQNCLDKIDLMHEVEYEFLDKDNLTQRPYLLVHNGILKIQGDIGEPWGIDFKKYLQLWKTQQLGIRSEPLAKALGIKGEIQKRIGDFSCGTGKDCSMLLYWKQEVIAYERDPWVYLLLKDAHFRLKLSSDKSDREAADLLTLNFGEPEEIKLLALDCIYYDPMFSETGKKNSAKSRKEMELLKKIVGADLDAQDNLKKYLQYCPRIVVKRGDKNPFIIENPHNTWKGKTVCFDLYLP